ncbi:hypothetical protein PFTANZ_00436 [Plasmodium falciparum Tanzania (2000708)]|uniref:Surface antigen n=1 Tax=Plasmodium falciparum Tanzania (2000708) TaxID=1036725 RepID=A0A024WE78_PLAFA|nr:hypothetical protein PFTANZ_00436 [Plasmodium falciparum Tanzania (2000708)]
MIHYINILLFELPLNILVYNQRNHKSTTHHTLKIPITRLLCECDIYTSIYDNDPQMKEVMQQFEDRTSQRFHEYDERMKTTRQKCKEQCNKEIQKIILKDKLEKELMDKIVTLDTDIQNDAIPTCICEKSLADKVEKTCLKCGGVLGGGVTPAWGLISGIVYTGWKAAALAAAKELAEKAGAAAGEAAGIKEGIKVVMKGLLTDFRLSTQAVQKIGLVFDGTNYYDASYITEAVYAKINGTCLPGFPAYGRSRIPVIYQAFCDSMLEKPLLTHNVLDRDLIKSNIETYVQKIVSDAKFTAAATAETAAEEATNLAMETNTAAVNATYAGYQTPIIASIVAIVVIVLIMIIIYLVLRYRRKKKMKKKLQYIKLLEE